MERHAHSPRLPRWRGVTHAAPALKRPGRQALGGRLLFAGSAGRRCGRCKIVRLFACLLLPVFFHACLSAARWSIALLARWPSRQRRGSFEAQALRAGARPGAKRL
jgi:hypothetical protein